MSRRLHVPLFPDGLYGSDYYSSTAESVLWHASPLQSATRLPHWLWCGKCKFGVAVNFLTWTELKWLYLKGRRVVQKVILSSISYGDMNQTNSMQTKLLHKRRWQWIHSIYNRNKAMLEGATSYRCAVLKIVKTACPASLQSLYLEHIISTLLKVLPVS